MKQIQREIEDLAIPELFLAYHPNNHAVTRHIQMTHLDLKNRLRYIPYQSDEIISMSRFLPDMDLCDVSQCISTCLMENLDDVESWMKKAPNHSHEFLFDFPAPIGEGIVKGTDWNQLFPMSGICVALMESNLRGRTFQVISAYPIFNADEIDVVWDAIDAWTMVQKQKRNGQT